MAYSQEGPARAIYWYGQGDPGGFKAWTSSLHSGKVGDSFFIKIPKFLCASKTFMDGKLRSLGPPKALSTDASWGI